MVFLAGLLPLSVARSIRPGVPWFDTEGHRINAHGAGILTHGGRFYWYGSRRCMDCPGIAMNGGIALYSSADLYQWAYEGLVLPVFNCSSEANAPYPPPSCKNGNGLDLERPKVVQCGGEGGKFIMWVRGTGYGNTPQLLAVLEADSPLGPFTFVSNRTASDDPFKTIAPGISNYPPGYQFADATLFQDPATHKTYVYWRTRIENGLNGPTGFRGMELTPDCRDVSHGSDERIFASPDREGPAVFLHNGTYYLWTSGTMGWSPTAAFLYSASSPLGAFANSSDPGHGWHAYVKGPTGNSSTWNGTWDVRDGYLAAGSTWGPSEKQNLTLPAAEALCTRAADCAGFTFEAVSRCPPSKQTLSVALKTRVDFVPEHDVGLQPPPIPSPGRPGNRKPEQPGLWAFDSQSTFVLPNPVYRAGSKVPPFIYMADRWDYRSDVGVSNATYVWLPLFIDPLHPHHVSVVWADEWRLDDATLNPFS